MFEKIKTRIKTAGRNIVYDAMRKFYIDNDIIPVFKASPPVPGNSSEAASKLRPVDLGYFSNNYGPPIDNAKLANCKVVADRYAALPYMPKNAVCAEIGIAYGDFSQEIINAMQPKELFLFDVYTEKPGGAEWWGQKRLAESGLIHEEFIKNRFAKYGNVFTKKGKSWEALQRFPDDYFDYVYVDGNHTYGGVKQDIAALKKKVKNGGIIAFNDYTYFGIYAGSEYGVLRAVNEFLAEGNHEVVMYCLRVNKMDDIIIKLAK